MSHLRAGAILVSVLLIMIGAVVVWQAFANSPAVKISTQAQIDKQRAIRLKLASSPNSQNPSGFVAKRVPWVPTLPGEVADVTIPSLEVSAPVIPEAPDNGSLTIPANVHQVGWDMQTSSPGSDGVTLLVGHVNWVGQGEGALGQIGQLVPGDQIVLNWAGYQSNWKVSAPPRLSPNTIVHRSLFSKSGSPTLALVTCGGAFSETSQGGSYADNVIVLATPITMSAPVSIPTPIPTPIPLDLQSQNKKAS